MKRVPVDAHLSASWLFESAKRPNDRPEYCLWCTFSPSASARSCGRTVFRARRNERSQRTGSPSSTDHFRCLRENQLAQMRFELGTSRPRVKHSAVVPYWLGRGGTRGCADSGALEKRNSGGFSESKDSRASRKSESLRGSRRGLDPERST